MVFCNNCGAQVADGVKFCPSCGAPVAPAQAAPQQPAQQAAQDDFSSKVAALNNTADTTGEFDPADIEKNKVMAILAYLSWLVLIPLFAAKESKFARYHVNQGLVLAITEIVWWIVSGILTAIIPILSLVLGIVNIVFVIMLIIGIINAANGKAKELPVIGKFRIIK